MRVPGAPLAVVLAATTLLVCGLAVAGAGAGPDAGARVTPPDPELVITVNVTEGGDARWSIAHRFRLEDENDTRAFRDLARRVADGDVPLPYSEEYFERTAGLVADHTGREGMTIRNARWVNRTDNGTGVLALRFTWTDFAAVEGDRVIVGDAFNTSEGTWLPALQDGQRLVVSAPPMYGIDYSPRPVDNGTVAWTGPYEFGPNEIRLTYTAPPGSPTPPGGPGGPDGTTLPVALLTVGVVVLVVSVGAGGYLYARRRTDDDALPAGDAADAPGSSRSDADAGTAADDAGDPSDDGASPAPADSATAADAETAGAVDNDGGVAGADAEDAEDVDPELLSDEERVERLLRHNGGRMMQADIVTETGWSNAKVSQLLSTMHDADRIDKHRLGRENLISLPEENVGEFDG